MTTPDDLRALIQRSLTSAPTDTPEPERGQVWSAFWGDVRIPVLLETVSDTHVGAVPVTGDADVVPNARAILNRGESPLGYEAAVWNIQPLDLPVFVLDAAYGSIDMDEVESQHEDNGPSGAKRELDPRYRFLDSVSGDMQQLADAVWLPEEVSAVAPLRPYMRQGVTPRTLRDALDVSDGVLGRILDHGWWLDTGQRERVSTVFGIDSSELPPGDPLAHTPAFRRVLEWPAWRQRFVRYANRMGKREGWARFYAAETGLAGGHARSVPGADQDTRYWAELVDDLFAS